MKQIHKCCDNCKHEFGDYHINLGIKGTGDGVGKTNMAYFYFCDLLCASKFLKRIAAFSVSSEIEERLDKAGI